MRFVVLTIASAVFFAGCCSSKAPQTQRVAKSYKAPVVRTVTARPVARTMPAPTIVAPRMARTYTPPPAPPINHASTRSLPTARIVPTAVRAPAAVRYAPPPAPPIMETAVTAPEHCCEGGSCAVPTTNDCPGGCCAVPQAFDMIGK